MNRNWTTALILGAAWMPYPLATFAAIAPAVNVQPLEAHGSLRETAYDALPVFGPLRHHELFSLTQADGRLVADWRCAACPTHPWRVEMGDLDAEWRAESLDRQRWSLTRRDLVADHAGRFWTTRLTASFEDPAQLSLTASAQGENLGHSLHLTYEQQADRIRFRGLGWQDGKMIRPIDVSATDVLALQREALAGHLIPQVLAKLDLR